MKIGSQAQRSSAISAANADTIVVRGHDLCSELVGVVTFTDHVWLLVTGELPNAAQRRMLDATLVAIAEHGLVPSVAGEPHDAGRRARGAAGRGRGGHSRLRLGDPGFRGLRRAAVHRDPRARRERAARGGRARRARRAARRARAGPGLRPSTAQAAGSARRAPARGRPPRPACAGRHVEVAGVVETLVPEIWGKPLAMNVSGAIAAVLLDAGYPLLALKGVPMLARTASLIAHLLEEQQRPIGFVLADSGASAIDYDGARPDGFEPGEG